MRGLMRIQNRLNRIEAWADWNRLAATAPEMAARFAPSATAGARTIDKRIAALRAALAQVNEATPPAA
jgi:hypothetical protein